MMEPTLQQKYDWLCKQMRVRDIDVFECDALLAHKGITTYFQFPTQEEFPISVDRAIIHAMQEETNQS